MPFTLCHPAMVIPIYRAARRITSLAGLVIGSMAPDFVYVIPVGASGAFTHSFLGVLGYCLPAGVTVYIVYYGVLRKPVLAFLPAVFRARMPEQVEWSLRRFRTLSIVLGSLAIGASTHVFWDSFTHAETVITSRYSFFNSTMTFAGREIPLFKILQQISSLAGFAVIAACLSTWVGRCPPRALSPHRLSMNWRLATLGIVCATSAAGGVVGLMVRESQSVERGFFNFVVTAMGTAAVTILILCIGWSISLRRNEGWKR